MDSWREIYIAAVAERDPAKQRGLVYQAIVAIEERRLSLAPCEEFEAMKEAEKALKVLKRSLSESRRMRKD